MKRKTGLEEYMAELDREFDRRQTDEDFAKADKRERERKALEFIGKCYKYLTSDLNYSGDETAEILLKSKPPFLGKLGLTPDEARSLILVECRKK